MIINNFTQYTDSIYWLKILVLSQPMKIHLKYPKFIANEPSYKTLGTNVPIHKNLNYLKCMLITFQEVFFSLLTLISAESCL